MRAGAMRDRVTFYRPLDSTETDQNSFGEDDASSPQIVGTFPAKVEEMVGTELARMQEKWAEARYMITMRHQPGIVFRAKMTAVWLSRTSDASLNRAIDILNINDPGNTLRPTITMIARDFAG